MRATPLLEAVAVSALLVACSDSSSIETEDGGIATASGPAGGISESSAQEIPVTRLDLLLGDPLPGLTAAELAAFTAGRAVFERRFKPSEGLGPLYNAVACSSCHSTPEAGGSAQLYRNFYVASFGPDPSVQSALPGLPSIVVPSFGAPPHASADFSLEEGRHVIPDLQFGFLPVVQAQRNAIPVFGTGMFEFITNVTILSNADPDDSDGDGISGRANFDPVGLGRFGVKAQVNNLELFTRGPLQNQMGITSRKFLGDGAVVSLSFLQAGSDPNNPTTDADAISDPEISHDDLGNLIAFTRFLAPPMRKELDENARHGQEIFEVSGCVACHIPSLPTTRFGEAEAYTDLLLHYMGDELADGINIGTPQPSMLDPDYTGTEFRTQPLWGVSMHGPFLHDGRAETLHDAILMHGGEAQSARDAYAARSAADQAAVINFLERL